MGGGANIISFISDIYILHIAVLIIMVKLKRSSNIFFFFTFLFIALPLEGNEGGLGGRNKLVVCMPNVYMYGIVGLHEDVSLRGGREGGRERPAARKFISMGGGDYVKCVKR